MKPRRGRTGSGDAGQRGDLAAPGAGRVDHRAGACRSPSRSSARPVTALARRAGAPVTVAPVRTARAVAPGRPEQRGRRRASAGPGRPADSGRRRRGRGARCGSSSRSPSAATSSAVDPGRPLAGRRAPRSAAQRHAVGRPPRGRPWARTRSRRRERRDRAGGLAPQRGGAAGRGRARRRAPCRRRACCPRPRRSCRRPPGPRSTTSTRRPGPGGAEAHAAPTTPAPITTTSGTCSGGTRSSTSHTTAAP